MRSRSRRSTGTFRQNWKFMVLITVLSGATAMGIAVATQGLEGMMRRASLALRAMDNPTELSKDDKNELKKMLATKGGDAASAKKQFANMSAAEKEQAKQQFSQLDEAEKKKLKALFGK